ncbi:prepilin-type N-terminal cleavage/methylation domain-containing protein [Moritella sp. F3]|uniref:prepilin-type N-terminal cleavage/methylation domain-containing protein n=1 Tax=Moritella sp. F3 TaxID=2718882 RepID=UPI0018E12BE3|nr:type II secretion system protein [Moritella sp. F3]GIC79287.1 hypothetical protein FMO001_40140 [Moritella sp. F1]GIC80355.1 hypothetical protein FMO003_06360 [Moritella sp. F3]
MGFRAKGFTLIEMTIVIVILAIISAIAVPKFVNLSGDAKKAKIASVAAELRTAIDLIYYKSLILGLENECHDGTTDEVIVDGFLTCAGYPIGYISSIKKLLNLDNDDGFIFNNTTYKNQRILAISLNDSYFNEGMLVDSKGNIVNADGDVLSVNKEKDITMNCQLLYQPMSVHKVVVFDGDC